MKFIRKHTKGPWIADFSIVRSKAEFNSKHELNIVSRALQSEYRERQLSDSKIMSAAPEMLDYLIEEAKTRHSIIECVRNNGLIRPTREDEAQLERIIKLIKKAGVEVVE